MKLFRVTGTGRTGQSATTNPQRGYNRLEQAVAWKMVRPRRSTPSVHDLHIWSPVLFSVRLCERWGLRSANAYNVEQLERSNRNSDCKTERPLLSNVWNKTEHRVYWCRATNGFLGAFENCEERRLASSWLSVRPAIRTHGTRLPLDGFSWHFILHIFQKSVEKI